jgi:hypothetical protein
MKEVLIMTKREMFSAIREAVAGNVDMVEFIDHEIELLDRKSATPKKPTKTQIENENLKADILVFLSGADAPQNVKDITAGVDSLNDASCQKVSRLLADLVKSGSIVKDYVKKVPFFSIA